jgi:hypothetical protein
MDIWLHGHLAAQRGKYHCTVDLLFDWFGLVHLANKNKNCQLSNSQYQTSQTGGQWYSDTSPFSIPWLHGHLADGLLAAQTFGWQAFDQLTFS